MTIIKDNSQYYNFPPELEPYRNLIWCPLDYPDPPEIDEDKFFQWIQSCIERDRGTIAGSVAGAVGPIKFDDPNLQRTASYSGKGVYPWNLMHVMRSDIGWRHFDSLKEQLPELAEYIKNLPVEEFMTISFLNQKPGIDVGLHTDPDIWFGFRFYLINKSGARIFFQKAKTPSDRRLLNISEELIVGGSGPEPEIAKRVVTHSWESVCQDEVIYGKYPRDRFAFHLTATHATHGVESVPEDNSHDRVTGFIICRFKAKEYAEILRRSVEKYSDYAVWW